MGFPGTTFPSVVGPQSPPLIPKRNTSPHLANFGRSRKFRANSFDSRGKEDLLQTTSSSRPRGRCTCSKGIESESSRTRLSVPRESASSARSRKLLRAAALVHGGGQKADIFPEPKMEFMRPKTQRIADFKISSNKSNSPGRAPFSKSAVLSPGAGNLEGKSAA